MRMIDLAGEKFGRLLAIRSEQRRTKSGRAKIYWVCSCDCGNQTIVEGSALKNGGISSCGCLQRERISARTTTHGQSKTRLYRIWGAMIARCNSSDLEVYRNYAGRGITVCDRWVNSFEAFRDDVGHPPTNKHTIDRINNDLGYFPGNTRWATPAEQSRNRRGLIIVEYNGQTMCLMDAAHLAGIPYITARTRIVRDGWSHERALSQPPKRCGLNSARKGD